MMIIKICGLKLKENIEDISLLSPDFIGFIFYQKSKRFVGKDFSRNHISKVPKPIKKVGVFVNETIESIIKIQNQFQFDYIQLHGDETPDYCMALKEKNISIIKAFQIDESFNFFQLKQYQPYCKFFLFDTKSSNYGGSGKPFNWSVLNRYTFQTPFLLSGGIGLENYDKAITLSHPKLVGLDINSKIEITPALKSIEKATTLITKIKKS